MYLDSPAFHIDLDHECLDKDDLWKIRSIFEELHYGDGIISEDEFMTISSQLGKKELTREEAKQEVLKTDLNGDGQVEFFEFKKRLEKLEARADKNWKYFLLIDTNHDSHLSSEEWRFFMMAVGVDASEETEKQWRLKADTNNDGYVSCKEFRKIYQDDDPLFS